MPCLGDCLEWNDLLQPSKQGHSDMGTKGQRGGSQAAWPRGCTTAVMGVIFQRRHWREAWLTCSMKHLVLSERDSDSHITLLPALWEQEDCFPHTHPPYHFCLRNESSSAWPNYSSDVSQNGAAGTYSTSLDLKLCNSAKPKATRSRQLN